MRTLAFINLKGGVGKTVSAANMAHVLAAVHHRKALLADGDKQGGASRYEEERAETWMERAGALEAATDALRKRRQAGGDHEQYRAGTYEA